MYNVRVMISFAVPSLAALALVAPSLASVAWQTDLPAAQEKAAAEGKKVLVLFTGSDWCPPCIALKKNILSQPSFEAYAQEHFVLVELDFPRKPASPNALAANKKLQRKYNVSAFPTMLALSPEGVALAGFVGGVAGLSDLEERLRPATAPSKEVADALEGLSADSSITRVEAYMALIPTLPQEVLRHNAFLESFLEELVAEAEREQATKQSHLDDDGVKEEEMQDGQELDEIEIYIKELDDLGENYKAILEYCEEKLVQKDLDINIKLLFHSQKVNALLNLATDEDQVQKLRSYITEVVIPELQEEFSDECEHLQEIADDLSDPDVVKELIEENSAG